VIPTSAGKGGGGKKRKEGVRCQGGMEGSFPHLRPVQGSKGGASGRGGGEYDLLCNAYKMSIYHREEDQAHRPKGLKERAAAFARVSAGS